MAFRLRSRRRSFCDIGVVGGTSAEHDDHHEDDDGEDGSNSAHRDGDHFLVDARVCGDPGTAGRPDRSRPKRLQGGLRCGRTGGRRGGVKRVLRKTVGENRLRRGPRDFEGGLAAFTAHPFACEFVGHGVLMTAFTALKCQAHMRTPIDCPTGAILIEILIGFHLSASMWAEFNDAMRQCPGRSIRPESTFHPGERYG